MEVICPRSKPFCPSRELLHGSPHSCSLVALLPAVLLGPQERRFLLAVTGAEETPPGACSPSRRSAGSCRRALGLEAGWFAGPGLQRGCQAGSSRVSSKTLSAVASRVRESRWTLVCIGGCGVCSAGITPSTGASGANLAACRQRGGLRARRAAVVREEGIPSCLLLALLPLWVRVTVRMATRSLSMLPGFLMLPEVRSSLLQAKKWSNQSALLC